MKKFKYILFCVLLVLLWLPFFQMIFLVVRSQPLKGAYLPHAKPDLNDSTWFEGSFQKDYEEYINDTIGFHEDFVRLRNQIDYSLFDKCHSHDIEVGKNGYLVATWHIDAHLGKLRGREARIDSVVMMLSQLNDTLLKKNKTLVILFAPNRGAYYKELAPSWYDLTPVHESDYQRYTRLLANTKVKHIDFNKYFLQQKPKTKYPLYTKCGIHWSAYGSAMAADSFVKYIEKVRQVDLPDVHVSEIKQSRKAKGADADLSNTLNLIWPVKNDKMAYPKFWFKKYEKAKLKLLGIGDSYYLGMLDSEIIGEIFEEHSFWYYNSSIVSNGPNGGRTTKDVEFENEINKHEVVTILATESTLKDFGWGFIDKAWETYCKPHP